MNRRQEAREDIRTQLEQDSSDREDEENDFRDEEYMAWERLETDLIDFFRSFQLGTEADKEMK